MIRMQGNKGFTMIEVLVVITMLGILSAILMPKVAKQMDKPKKSRAVVEIKTMKNAMDAYYAEKNGYPTGSEIVTVMQNEGVLGDKFGKGALDPWKNPYYITSTATTYTIWSEGPNNIDSNKDDIYTTESMTEIYVDGEKHDITDAVDSEGDGDTNVNA